MENLGCITNPNMTFSKFYNPSENLAIDEVVQRRAILTQYIPKKQPF
jgi:hypothetical protein